MCDFNKVVCVYAVTVHLSVLLFWFAFLFYSTNLLEFRARLTSGYFQATYTFSSSSQKCKLFWNKDTNEVVVVVNNQGEDVFQIVLNALPFFALQLILFWRCVVLLKAIFPTILPCWENLNSYQNSPKYWLSTAFPFLLDCIQTEVAVRASTKVNIQ